MSERIGILVLEDGRTFLGKPIGMPGERLGEVVFNTSMTGYQEIISDPSYCGQIVTFTAPQIGNYGVCSQDEQAQKPVLSGVLIREMSRITSNQRATDSLDSWLTKNRVVGLTGVDTRAVTRHIREKGAMRGGIFCLEAQPATIQPLLDKVLAHESLEGLDLTSRVSSAKPYTAQAEGNRLYRVVCLDFGVKRGVLKSLTKRHVAVDVVPAKVSAETVLQHQPDGIVLSNGPGDPAAVHSAIETTRRLIGRLPILGICLGHQILALALGAKTYKLDFGHHGGNHPVRDLATGQVWITAQNHGFAVDLASLPNGVLQPTHISLFDQTLEGFASRKQAILALQFHPEACPGPSDAHSVFDRFVMMLQRGPLEQAGPAASSIRAGI